MDFTPFSEIVRLNTNVTITEKINGTNAQVMIWEADDGFPHILAASRNRLITPADDNYGFARWVDDHYAELIATLGPGRHFGEWYGSGIDTGYGLPKGVKRFALFDQRHKEAASSINSPIGLEVVPVLYQGPFADGVVQAAMDDLKANGSKAAPGFLRPEGVVVRFERNGTLFKQVFDAEETAWKHVKPAPGPAPDLTDILPYLQPIRLNKLLLRDETLLREYPQSLPAIAKAYVLDLEKESLEFVALDRAILRAVKKQIFPWIKEVLKEKGYSA